MGVDSYAVYVGVDSYAVCVGVDSYAVFRNASAVNYVYIVVFLSSLLRIRSR